jgi:hypothetical protein
MNSRIKLSIRVLTIGVTLAIIWFFTGSLIKHLLAGTISLLAFLVSVLFLPAVLFVLGWFAYSVFLKRYVRARRIAKIRNARYLREAVERGDSERHTEESTRGVGEDSDPSLRSG